MIRSGTALAVCLAALGLSGCSALRNHYAPVTSTSVGVDAQNEALRAQIEPDPAGGTPSFAPIQRAERALARARSGQASAALLEQASQALTSARDAWSQVGAADNVDATRLAGVAADAHRARRLAQVARYRAEAGAHQSQIARLQRQRQRQAASATSAARGGAGPGERLLVPDQLGAIYFQPGSARVRASSRSVVRKLAKLLQQPDNAARRIGVAGRAATVAPDQDTVAAFIKANPKIKQRAKTPAQQTIAYRQALAVTRARDIARLLMQAGVAGERIGIGVASADQMGGGAAGGDVAVEMIERGAGGAKR